MNTTIIENKNEKKWKILGLIGIAILAVAFVIGIWGFFGKSEMTAKTNYASGQIPNAARASADYARLAAPILDEVDNLEKVFG